MNSLLTHTRKADIVFFRSGKMEVARRLSLMLGLRNGDVLNVAQEEGNLYLYVSSGTCRTGRHEATCRSLSPGGRRFRAYSATLARIIAELTNKTDAQQVGLFAGEPLLSPAYGIYAQLFLQNPLVG